MSENSIDDKYKIPREKILQSNIHESFTWDRITGRPDIKTPHDVTFYETTGDYVATNNLYDVLHVNLEIKCRLPDVCGSIGNFYIGGWNYYSELLGNNTLRAHGPDNSSCVISYCPHDIYTQSYDTSEVQFKKNGCTFATFNYRLPNNYPRESLWFGFDGPDVESNKHVHVRNIDTYVSGRKGRNGLEGNRIDSGIGIADNSDGHSGDFYYNYAANTLYGRKEGIGGCLFFDGIHGNNTSLVIPNESELVLGTDNFTIEWFQYMTADTCGRVFSMVNNANTSGMAVKFVNHGSCGQSLKFVANGNDYCLDFEQYKLRWIHIAITRFENQLVLHVDGVFQNETDFDENLADNTDNLVIGNVANDNVTGDYKGYLTNFRMIKGRAVYTSVFDVPIQTLPATPDTVLLLTAATQATAFIDSSEDAENESNIVNNNVIWDPMTPFQSKGTWNSSPLIVKDTVLPLTITSSQSTLWDFNFNGLKSLVIYLNCAGSDKQPQNLSIITVNNGSEGIKLNVAGGLATGVQLGTSSSELFVTSSVNYPNSYARIMPIA